MWLRLALRNCAFTFLTHARSPHARSLLHFHTLTSPCVPRRFSSSPPLCRLAADCPGPSEAAALAAAVLACIPNLGGSVGMARNLVVAPTLGLATYPAGRAALRQGAAKWYLTQVWEEGGGGEGRVPRRGEEGRRRLPVLLVPTGYAQLLSDFRPPPPPSYPLLHRLPAAVPAQRASTRSSSAPPWPGPRASCGTAAAAALLSAGRHRRAGGRRHHLAWALQRQTWPQRWSGFWS